MSSQRSKIAVLAAVLALRAGAALAEEGNSSQAPQFRQPYYQPGQGYEQEPEYKFSGLIRQRPADKTAGSWIVDDRQIVVTPLTVLKEEQGKAAAGAAVTVKGVLKGISFIATEIEVKAAKQ